jgi:hypothetical protein
VSAADWIIGTIVLAGAGRFYVKEGIAAEYAASVPSLW